MLWPQAAQGPNRLARSFHGLRKAFDAQGLEEARCVLRLGWRGEYGTVEEVICGGPLGAFVTRMGGEPDRKAWVVVFGHRGWRQGAKAQVHALGPDRAGQVHAVVNPKPEFRRQLAHALTQLQIGTVREPRLAQQEASESSANGGPQARQKARFILRPQTTWAQGQERRRKLLAIIQEAMK